MSWVTVMMSTPMSSACRTFRIAPRIASVWAATYVLVKLARTLESS